MFMPFATLQQIRKYEMHAKFLLTIDNRHKRNEIIEINQAWSGTCGHNRFGNITLKFLQSNM